MIKCNLCFGLATAFVLFLNTHALDAGTIKPVRLPGFGGVTPEHQRWISAPLPRLLAPQPQI